MRILIDLQSLQSGSRYRGIGRYSLSLASEMIRISGDQHEFSLLLNGAFPDQVQEVRSAFSGLVDQKNIHVFYPPFSTAEAAVESGWQVRVAEEVRQFCISQIRPDIIHVTSLFEGFEDDAVTSVFGIEKTGIPTVVTLYDLIPLLNQGEYLVNERYKKYYLRKIEFVKNADLLLAISNSSRQEAIDHLGKSADSIVNISAAVDTKYFRPTTARAEFGKRLIELGIVRDYLVCAPGGYDSRKNCESLIKAFASLSIEIRKKHQLVIASRIDNVTFENLTQLMQELGLGTDELILTGYLENRDLVDLYSSAKASVFPSKHEGFGLPALEAMACGTPTIGSNTTSIPEVVGLDEALFDPYSVSSISQKIYEVLTDDEFRQRLKIFGLKRAGEFSWTRSAQLAMTAILNLADRPRSSIGFFAQTGMGHKPTLAYLSPMPPEKSGISNYSADLIPALAQFYNVEVISPSGVTDDPWIQQNCQMRTVDWFWRNADKYHRILYHFGNSPFHSHMFDLLKSFPGVVVMHDFFMSGVLCHDEIHGFSPGVWTKALYKSHGYAALKKRSANGDEAVKKDFPNNLDVIQKALGVIVHSEYSKVLAREWYESTAADDWKLIPLLRVSAENIDQVSARAQLGLSQDAFVVCSFGFLDPSKCNHRLLAAWCQSQLKNNVNCKLIFVGENHGGEYGKSLLSTIKKMGLSGSVFITGWTDFEHYNTYLAASTIAVQLRVESRGETSGAVLDCLNYSLPTIINANGSMADIPGNAALKIPDEFTDNELAQALNDLYLQSELRKKFSIQAKNLIATSHDPMSCAQSYFEVIEQVYRHQGYSYRSVIKNILGVEGMSVGDEVLSTVSNSLAMAQNLKIKRQQILVDVTSLMQTDLKTGVERVVRAEVLEMLLNPPPGYYVEPVYFAGLPGREHYVYAREFTLKFLGITNRGLVDLPVEVSSGDIFYGLDLAPGAVIRAAKSGLYKNWMAQGLKIYFLVYDLIPVLNPEFFPPGADAGHSEWLVTVARSSSGLITISNSVANELRTWLKSQRNIHPELMNLPIVAVHLGADVASSMPTKGTPQGGDNALRKIKSRPTFLLVGTIEPRKGHLQTLEAFSHLWSRNLDVNLVIVGREGWKHLIKNLRRSIPKTISAIRNHSEYNERLFWFEGVSDEFLAEIYSSAKCLLFPSEAEGFGLPLIEAAQHSLPILARDIPVFREVAGDHVIYFSGLNPEDLSSAIEQWLNLNLKGQIPMSSNIQWSTWKQTVRKVLTVLIGNTKAPTTEVSAFRQKAIDEHLERIHAARVSMTQTLLPPGQVILDLGGANCPLYKMGYPHKFRKLTLIDLPPDQRHDYYKDIVVDNESPLGPIVIRYTDMTTLEGIEDSSVDFVWSGQSIEHVSEEAGQRMCKEAMRVLKQDGYFCLDTPNRRLTEIHTATIGGGFIHPEHQVEYTSEQLIKILKNAGFQIEKSYGICEMPETLATGVFHYEDFINGKQVTPQVEDGYIQLHICRKI